MMWSEKYNPMVCFDALYSTSEGQSLEELEILESCSGSRIALPGGGYIDLPGIESPPEPEESMFPSERFQTTEPLCSSSGSRIALPGGGYIDLPGVESPPEQDEHMYPSDLFGNNSGSRIELPGGGFIDLPGLESPSEQEEHMFPSDIFQDYGLLDESRIVSQQEHVPCLYSGFQSMEIKLAQKDQIIIQQERETKRLREHLNRFMRIVTDRNFELHNLRSEASEAIRDLRAWGARHQRRNKYLYEELDKKDAAIAALLCKACSAPLLRRLLEKGKKERDELKENLDAMERNAQDLMTKNSLLEHELTVIPKELMSSLIEQEGKERVELQEKLDAMEKSVKDLMTKNSMLEHELTAIKKEMVSRLSLIEKGGKEREELQEKLDVMEKSVQDLMTKNRVLEHELTVITKEMVSRASLIEKGEKVREELQEKLDAMEKSLQDLMTKNRVLEHELTVIPKEMMCRSDSKSFIKAEVHTQGACSMSNEPSSANNPDQCCTTTTVDEQKTCQSGKEDDPEQILVLQSQVVPASENKENFLKKAKKVLTLAKWRRNETSKPQSHLHADSSKRMN